MSRQLGSSKTVVASVKEIPCLLKLIWAFSSFHSNPGIIDFLSTTIAFYPSKFSGVIDAGIICGGLSLDLDFQYGRG
jgi:hypothetical protein